MRFLSAAMILGLLAACSPYKKIELSASDRLTKNWKGTSEGAVVVAYGSYQKKISASDGYFLRYDYSYVLRSIPAQSGDLQIRATHQPGSPMVPRSTDSHSGQGGTGDSVIKRIDFFFDKTQRVQYVEAIGFPDSVYYVKRK